MPGSSFESQSALREARATLKAWSLLPLDWAPCLPGTDGDDCVVFVHGFLASAGLWRPLRAEVERAGFSVATFSHWPGIGVRAIAHELAGVVEQLPRRSRVHLVGHSLGGIVARWFVQELGGADRVTQTVSIGSPFGGSPAADRLPVLVGRELCRQSALLERLRTGSSSVVPHLSIIGGQDRLVPGGSGIFPHGDVLALHDRGHNGLLFDQRVIRSVLARLERFRASGVEGSLLRSEVA